MLTAGDNSTIPFVLKATPKADDCLPKNPEDDYSEILGRIEIPEDRVPAVYKECVPGHATAADQEAGMST
jgi:hypothetical protein